MHWIKIKKDGIKNWAAHNARYNADVVGIAQDICQTEHLGIIDYVPAKPIARNSALWAPGKRPEEEIVLGEQVSPSSDNLRFNLAGAGPYERMLFSCVAWGAYSTYVLVGEMGSGKTSSLNYLIELLERDRSHHCNRCTECSPILVYLNFNQGFASKHAHVNIHSFRRRLYEQLRTHLKKVLNSGSVVHRFKDAMLKETTKRGYEGFGPLVDQWEEQSARLSTRDLTRQLIKYIDEYSAEYFERLELMMWVARFVKETVRSDSACFCMIFDNLDSVNVEAQYDILVEILALQSIAKVKAVVALRLSNFERLNTQAAYSFGVIIHGGASVAEIITRRLTEYERQWESKFHIAQASPFAPFVRQRIAYLRDPKHGPSVVRQIEQYSGASARLALFMMERAFINNLSKYDMDPRYPDELIRAMIVSGNDGHHIDIEDRCVANVFVEKSTERMSLLPVRILQLAYGLAEYKRWRNVRSFVMILKGMRPEWSVTAIRSAINYLLHVKRPLIWVDGKCSYASNAEMETSDDIVYLTLAGQNYLTTLLNDLVYIQECMMSLSWPEEAVLGAVDYRIPMERFAVLRMCIECVMKADIEELERFVSWKKSQRDLPPLIERCVSARIIKHTATSVLAILQAWRKDNFEAEILVAEELEYWLSLILSARNAELRLGIDLKGAGLERVIGVFAANGILVPRRPGIRRT